MCVVYVACLLHMYTVYALPVCDMCVSCVRVHECCMSIANMVHSCSLFAFLCLYDLYDYYVCCQCMMCVNFVCVSFFLHVCYVNYVCYTLLLNLFSLLHLSYTLTNILYPDMTNIDFRPKFGFIRERWVSCRALIFLHSS